MTRILGVDHGSVRIGLAVSDELQMLAMPLATIPATPAERAVQEIVRIAGEKSANRVVVGLPRNMDGSDGPSAQAARAFATALREAGAGLAVELWDERLTTVAAQRSLQEAGRTAKKSRAVVDQVAAQILLQSWLDAQPGAGF